MSLPHCPKVSTFMMPAKKIISTNLEKAVKSLSFWLLCNPLQVPVGSFPGLVVLKSFSVKSQGFQASSQSCCALCASFAQIAISFGADLSDHQSHA